MTEAAGEWQAVLALDVRADIGEGPVWHAAEGVLYWVDIMHGRLHRFDPRGGDTHFDVGQPLGAAVPRADGGFVLALRDGFGLVEHGTRSVRLVSGVESNLTGNRMNDGKCDERGRFWAGTMPVDEAAAVGTLYRYSPDGTVAAMVPSVTISNGIDWSLDGKTMYYIDTATHGVDAFDFDLDAGTIANRRRLIVISAEEGAPDGMTVDAQGNLWVALWGGWSVRRFRPDGAAAGTVHVAASQVTSCTFGGADLRDLYITTARRDLTSAQLAAQPDAGGVFVAHLDVAGRRPHFFAG